MGEISLQVLQVCDIRCGSYLNWGDSEEQHVSRLEDLAAIQEEGLKVNRQKVQLVQQEVKYLGAMRGIEGQAPDKQSVELIPELPSPTALPS